MTHEELIARLRQDDTDFWHCEAADRIEALVKVRREDALELLAAHGQAQEAHEAQLKAEARAERLEAEMQKAIMLAEQPHYGDRDDALDHCFDAIDVLRAALKGADHD